MYIFFPRYILTIHKLIPTPVGITLHPMITTVNDEHVSDFVWQFVTRGGTWNCNVQASKKGS